MQASFAGRQDMRKLCACRVLKVQYEAKRLIFSNHVESFGLA
jgi:hypothetical protein